MHLGTYVPTVSIDYVFHPSHLLCRADALAYKPAALDKADGDWGKVQSQK